MKNFFIAFILTLFLILTTAQAWDYLNSLNDSSTSKNLTFTTSENKTVWIRLSKNTRVINAKLNLTGYSLPTNFTTENTTDTIHDNFYYNFSYNEWRRIDQVPAGTRDDLIMYTPKTMTGYVISVDILWNSSLYTEAYPNRVTDGKWSAAYAYVPDCDLVDYSNNTVTISSNGIYYICFEAISENGRKAIMELTVNCIGEPSCNNAPLRWEWYDIANTVKTYITNPYLDAISDGDSEWSLPDAEFQDSKAVLEKLNDSSEAKNLTFSGNENKTTWVKIPKNADVTEAKLNLSGLTEVNLTNYTNFFSSTLTYLENSANNDTHLWVDIGGGFTSGNIGVWKTDGTYVEAWTPSNGSVLGGIFHNQTYIWTADYGEQEIDRYFANKTYDVSFDLNTSNHDCLGLAKIGEVLYVGNFTEILFKYDISGSFLGTLNISPCSKPIDIASRDNDLYIINRTGTYPNYDFKVCKFENETFISAFDIPSELKDGYGVAGITCNNTHMWLADNDDIVMYRFDFVYPNSPYLDVGGDGDTEWSYSGEFNHTNNRTSDFSTEIDSYLSTCSEDSEGNCNVPLVLHSDTAGKIQISNIDITYKHQTTPNFSQEISDYLATCSDDPCDIPLTLHSDTAGKIQISAINITYGSPKWSNNKTSTPTYYDPNTLSHFNITWSDDNPYYIDVVYFESNFSGTPTNYTMSLIEGDQYSGVYNFNLTLPAGTFYWKSYANASDGIWNETDKWEFTVKKTPIEVSLYLNSTTTDKSYAQYTIANLTGAVNLSWVTVYLSFNATGYGDEFQSGLKTVENITNLTMSLGTYNVTASFKENTQNLSYSSNYKTLYLTVADADTPQYSNIKTSPTSPAVLEKNNNYQFNVTWVDNVDMSTAILEFNGVNYTAQNESSVFYKTLTGQDIGSNGTFSYKWYANDTSDNWATTSPQTYTLTLDIYKTLTPDKVLVDALVNWTVDVKFVGWGDLNYSLPVGYKDLNVTNSSNVQITFTNGTDYVNFTGETSQSNYTINYFTEAVVEMSPPPSCPDGYTMYSDYCKKILTFDDRYEYYYRQWVNVSDENVENFDVYYNISKSRFESWSSATNINYDVNDSAIGVSYNNVGDNVEFKINTSHGSSLVEGLHFLDLDYQVSRAETGGGGGGGVLSPLPICGNGYCEPNEDDPNSTYYCPEDCLPAEISFKTSPQIITDFIKPDKLYRKEIFILNPLEHEIKVRVYIAKVEDDSWEWATIIKGKERTKETIFTVPAGSAKSPSKLGFEVEVLTPPKIAIKDYRFNIILESGSLKRVVPFELKTFYLVPWIVEDYTTIALVVGLVLVLGVAVWVLFR